MFKQRSPPLQILQACPYRHETFTHVICCYAGVKCPAGYDPVLARLIQPWMSDSPSASSSLLFSVQMAADSCCKAAHQLLLLLRPDNATQVEACVLPWASALHELIATQLSLCTQMKVAPLNILAATTILSLLIKAGNQCWKQLVRPEMGTAGCAWRKECAVS